MLERVMAAVVAGITAAAMPAAAQFAPSSESVEGVLTGGRPYSPYADRRFPERPLWGDTHLHTALSVDAGLFGARLGLEEAYRFARDEQVISNTGQPVRPGRPLDWLVIADHSDAMGFIDDLRAGTPDVLAFEEARRWREGLLAGGQASATAALDLIDVFSQGRMPQALLADYSPGARRFATVWDKVIETADRCNDPGEFTAILGFEWTALVNGDNLHRNVLFRDGADRAGLVAPYTTQPPVGSSDPFDLYAWMTNYEQRTGGAVLAIAHDGNLSNGLMFPIDRDHTGRAVDEDYARLRARWEPLYEVTQIKGDGEAHPFLSPDDAFADFETWDAGNLDLSAEKTPDMLRFEYAREALESGLIPESRLGANPYKFGMVGSTDSHTALSTAEEDNFFGKHAGSEPSPERMNHPFTKTDQGEFAGWQTSASGYAAVWAEENTREAIWDAMARREVYATTGPRILVRFFGGWSFEEADFAGRTPAVAGYAKGVPMGGDLRARPEGAGAPNFLVYALRDPIGAYLERIQVVKGWLGPDGEPREKVHDVAWSGDRTPGADGKLPAVGDTVDLATASYANTIGAAELATVWTDPDFDPAQPAVYYVRVLEIPTPRWIVHDAVRFGVPMPEGAQTRQQERAYTSPIWYSPAG